MDDRLLWIRLVSVIRKKNTNLLQQCRLPSASEAISLVRTVCSTVLARIRLSTRIICWTRLLQTVRIDRTVFLVPILQIVVLLVRSARFAGTGQPCLFFVRLITRRSRLIPDERPLVRRQAIVKPTLVLTEFSGLAEFRVPLFTVEFRALLPIVLIFFASELTVRITSQLVAGLSFGFGRKVGSPLLSPLLNIFGRFQFQQSLDVIWLYELHPGSHDLPGVCSLFESVDLIWRSSGLPGDAGFHIKKVCRKISELTCCFVYVRSTHAKTDQSSLRQFLGKKFFVGQ